MKKVTFVLLILMANTNFLIGQSEAVIKKTSSGLTKIEFPNNNDNLLIGNNSGTSIVQGTNNTLIGNYTGLGLVDGSSNTLVGVGAGNVTSGSGNLALGFNAGQSSTGDNNVFLGKEAGFNAGTKSNTLWIENSPGDSSQALIYGEFDNNILSFNAHTDIYSDNATDEGLFVKKTHTGNSDIPAIKGESRQSDYYGIGVQGHSNYVGVQGQAFGTGSGLYYGTSGLSFTNNTGQNFGLYGFASGGATNYSIFGNSPGGNNNYAGYFQGKVNVKANLADSLIFKVETNNGDNLITALEDIVIIDNLRASGMTEVESISSPFGGEVTITDLKTVGSTDLEFESGKRIKKAVSMKYYIATGGAYPTDFFFDGILVGEIKLLSYAFISSGSPGGWLPCEGQLLNIADYLSLFSLIGIEYGGDGTSTFALPDMREAVPHHN